MNRIAIQEHKSKRRHFDLRLEIEDTKIFKSWAIPKAQFPEDKCLLAIPTPDHSEECSFFEGTYPKGSYGAGEVRIVDSGVYTKVEFLEDKITFEFKNQRYAIFKIAEEKWLWKKLQYDE